MAMDSFKLFASDNLGSVRAVYNEVGDSLWFVARDVCACLGIKNSRQACKELMNDEKANVILNDTSSDKKQARQYTLVNETGLYLLIMRSRKPEAVAFQRWISKELLPAFRKHELFQCSLEGTMVLTPENAKKGIYWEESWDEFQQTATEDMQPLQEMFDPFETAEYFDSFLDK